MASSTLINFRTATKYIAKMSGLPETVVQNWYPNYSANASKALNVRTAYNICNKMVNIGFGANSAIPSNLNIQNACSINTFKNLYNKLMGGRRWNVTNNINKFPYFKTIKILENGTQVLGYIQGGGGGSGGGAAAYASGKNSHASARGGNGASGGSSTVEWTYNGTRYSKTENGGGGGAGGSATSNNQGWITAAGSAGGLGAYGGQLTIGMNMGDIIKVTVGSGGGAGAAANTQGTANGGSASGPNGGSGWGGKAPNGGIANSSYMFGTYAKGGGTQTKNSMSCPGAATGKDSYHGNGGNSGGFALHGYNNKWVNIL